MALRARACRGEEGFSYHETGLQSDWIHLFKVPPAGEVLVSS